MIVVFGAVCIDRVRRVAYLPPAGGYVEVESEELFLGGEAANTANALAVWGRSVTLLGNQFGDDPLGVLLAAELVRHGFDAPEPQPGAQTPVCDIYVTPDGERTMYGRGFARMRPAYPLSSLDVVSTVWFTAEPNMPDDAREASARASDSGHRVYLMDFYRSNEMVPPGSFWQCSTDWVGKRGNTQANVVWVERWLQKHDCFTILSDGPNGFIAGGLGHPVRAYPPYPAAEVVDTTGAGDIFRAGVLYGLDQNWRLADSLRFASAAGCLKCQSFGATQRVPSVEDIHEHIRRHASVSRQYE